MTVIRQAPFALRIVERRDGRAGIVYRRMSDPNGNDRLQRIATLSPLAFTAATPLLRDAVRAAHPRGKTNGNGASLELATGPYHPLSADWGARIACFALLAAGLRDAERLILAAGHLRHSDPDEAAWWLGLMTREDNTRALRAFRILTEAVE
ncbi:MAG TPA: hypothetical protein VFB38_03225 [Chthonomonadaceae bacterium]|nr:hypothetical protein [Chthonomonadaceae bacterium]